MQFSHYETTNCIALCSAVHYYLRCDAVQLCHFASDFGAFFAVWWTPLLTVSYFCGHMCSAVYKMRFEASIFFKFWAFLAHQKTNFFSFVLGQVLNYWIIFSLFCVDFPNQHLLGWFGPIQNFVFKNYNTPTGI